MALGSSIEKNISSVLNAATREKKLVSMSGRRVMPRTSVEDVEDDSGQWTEVRRLCRSTSWSSMPELTPSRSIKHEEISALTLDQQRVVRAAEAQMKPADRDLIRKRMEAERPPREEKECASRGEGPSTKAKGKAVDARNWGAVGIN